MDSRYAYLIHLCGWALPVLAMQLAVMAWAFRGRTWAVLRAVLPPALVSTVWLVAADHLAISAGIWRFGEGKHLGVRVLSVPVEEILFFLITNLLVAFGLTLFSNLGRGRVRAPG